MAGLTGTFFTGRPLNGTHRGDTPAEAPQYNIARFEPLDTTLPRCSRGLRGHLDWHPMIPRVVLHLTGVELSVPRIVLR